VRTENSSSERGDAIEDKLRRQDALGRNRLCCGCDRCGHQLLSVDDLPAEGGGGWRAVLLGSDRFDIDEPVKVLDVAPP
jgi:hypothetical protein